MAHRFDRRVLRVVQEAQGRGPVGEAEHDQAGWRPVSLDVVRVTASYDVLPAVTRHDRGNELAILVIRRGVMNGDVYDQIGGHDKTLCGDGGRPRSSAADNARGWATGSQRSDRGDIDDVAFVNDLVDRLDADLCLDSAHRWAVGHSNGGGLVGILACESADRFTSFVAVSGAFYGQPGLCEPIRPIRLLEIHGDADPLVSYTGLAKAGVVVFPPIGEWLAGWAARQSCAVTPLEDQAGYGLKGEHQHWACPSPAAVEHIRIAGGGHDWPPGAAGAVLAFLQRTS